MASAVAAKVVGVLPNGLYALELEGGRAVTGHVAGKMRTNLVRLIAGDHVLVEVAPLDARKARIVGRAEAPRP